tara:strand:- start:44 stop:706 length:663 start_codon:yes stop_codon:yes gene_type:complete
MIRIFLKDEAELEKYTKSLGTDYTFEITGQGCIMATRNYLRHYYQHSEFEGVLFMDDDLTDFTELGKPLSMPFLDLIEYFFKETADRGLRYFGVNPSFNPFYWTDKIRTNLKYILGGFNGLIIDKDKDIIYCDIGHYEDYQFSLEHFLADGGIVSFDKYGIDTKRIQASGGIVGSIGKEQRDIDRVENAHYLVGRYNGMCKIVEKKYGTDLRMNTRYKNS